MMITPSPIRFPFWVSRMTMIATSIAVASTCLWAWGLPSIGLAENSQGIIIQQDAGQAVQVIIDPDLVPDARVKRSPDQFVISMPKGSMGHQGLTIDPKLSKSRTVQYVERENETVITVRSPQVGLSVQELSTLPAVQFTPTDAPKRSRASSATSVSSSPKSLKKLAESVVELPTLPKTPPKMKSQGAPDEVVLEDLGNTPATTTTSPTRDVDYPRDSDVSTRRRSYTSQRAAAPYAPTQTGSESGDLDTPAPPAGDGNTLSQEATTENPPPLASEDEGIPLSSVVKQEGTPLGETSGQWVIRMVFSLLAVIGLIAVFFKWGLPWWRQKFPAVDTYFSEKLGHAPGAPKKTPTRPGLEQGQKQDKVAAQNKKPLFQRAMATGEAVYQGAPKGDFGAPPDTTIGSDAAIANIPGTSSALMPFKVVSTLDLEQDKKLHLVNIKGFDLLLATTQHSVLFLRDLTESPSIDPNEIYEQLSLLQDPLLQEGSPQGNSPTLPISHSPADPTPQPSVEDELPPPKPTIELPQRKPKAQYTKASPEQELQALIEKYIQPDDLRPTSNEGQKNGQKPQPTVRHDAPPTTSQEVPVRDTGVRHLPKMLQQPNGSTSGFNPAVQEMPDLTAPSKPPASKPSVQPSAFKEEIVLLEDYDDEFQP